MDRQPAVCLVGHYGYNQSGSHLPSSVLDPDGCYHTLCDYRGSQWRAALLVPSVYKCTIIIISYHKSMACRMPEIAAKQNNLMSEQLFSWLTFKLYKAWYLMMCNVVNVFKTLKPPPPQKKKKKKKCPLALTTMKPLKSQSSKQANV